MYTSEQIKDYLHSRLPDEEMEAIKAAIHTDAELAARVRAAKDWLALEQMEIRAQAAEALQYAQQTTNSSRVKHRILRWGFGIAGVLLLVLAKPYVSEWLFPSKPEEIEQPTATPSPGNTTTDTVSVPSPPVAIQQKRPPIAVPSSVSDAAFIASSLEKYESKKIDLSMRYAPGKPSETHRVSKDFRPEDFYYAVKLYELNQLDSVLALLENCTSPDCNYLAGHAYFSKGNYEKAIGKFNESRERIAFSRKYLKEFYGSQLQYYLFLSYFATENWPAFQTIYELLKAEGDPDYFPRAEDLWKAANARKMIRLEQGLLLQDQIPAIFSLAQKTLAKQLGGF